MLIDRILSLLFPQSCPLCNNISTTHKIAPICPECWNNISPYKGGLCKRCGRPILSERARICGDCMKKEPPFTQAGSYGRYEGALEEAIKQLKYHGIKRLASPLSDLLLRMPLPDVDLIIPVPLHKNRLKERGFNQSALIARAVAKRLHRPLLVNTLIRTRYTIPQVSLTASERERNIRGAFVVEDNRRIHGKDIMLVDDVFTTGATVRECSKVLRRAGARNIYVITLARSVMD